LAAASSRMALLRGVATPWITVPIALLPSGTKEETRSVPAPVR
jgi:hypothetical protein